MIHIIYGDGKGKTTAAVGSAARAAGAGMKVAFIQFFKDGTSSEIRSLEKIGVECIFPDKNYRLFEQLTDERKKRFSDLCNRILIGLTESIENYDMIILDEGLDVCDMQLADTELICKLCSLCANERELIFTGHADIELLKKKADYISEIVSVRHPYERGIRARRGIEF